MLIKIYTNDGRGHFCGFDEDAELTMVHSFELDPKSTAVNISNPMNSLLGFIYVQLQAGVYRDIQPWATEYFGKQLRSLSVGDVVVVGETAWAVDNIGFTILTTEQLNNAIIWDDELNGVPK